MTSEQRKGRSGSNPPQLDTVETTATSDIPNDFSSYRQSQVQPDFGTALDLYRHFDDIEGKHRTVNLQECRRFAWFVVNKTSHKVQVASNACRLRWCPICSKARYNFIRQETRSYLLSIRKPKFLTLTMRHSDIPLSDQIKALYRHFRLFRQHKGLKSRIRGGVWFLQVKRGKNSGQWHPHLHCILDSDYIDKVALSADWQQTTGDSFVVDIRAIKDPGKVSDYVSRYAASPCRMSNFEESDRYEIFSVLHGRRLCGVWGTGRRISFRPRSVPDVSDWLKVGRWSDIVPFRRRCSNCKALWRAYITSKPLTEDEFQRFVSPDDLPDRNDWEGYDRYGATQLLFEEFQ